VPIIDVDVPTQDGTAGASLHVPGGAGPWPAVLMYPDAGGTRDVFRQMGDRLAGEGYVVLVPDIYHRSGGYEPFSMATVFTDPGERQRLRALAGTLTPDVVAGDAAAFADFLGGRPEVAPGPIGTTGYCLGGRMSLMAAGYLGERIGAAASFHGGGLAVEDDPGSPHHLAARVRAVVYVGGAENDPSFGEDQAARLHGAYTAAGVEHTIDHYAAAHGFAVPDNPPYDEAAAERHWAALAALYASTLR
jgi:carboxymethylenebutenolidase